MVIDHYFANLWPADAKKYFHIQNFYWKIHDNCTL